MNKKAKVLFAAITFFGSFFIFAHPAYAAYEVGISSNGLVDLGEIMPSPSSGALSNTASDTITVTTNCSAGYNVYATGTNGGSTSLVDTTHGNTIATSANAITLPNTLAPNTWGLVANQASATNGNFSGLPAYTTNLSSISPIYTAGSTEASIRDDHIPVYYGIKVDTDTVPGNYTTDVLYTVLMNSNCLRYTLNFDDNGATTNTLESQTVDFGTSVNLSNFSSTDKIAKTGHHLTGWKTKIGDTISDTILPINSNIVLDDGESAEVILIAQWEANIHTVTINKNAPDCSDTIHPTVDSSCRTPDGKIWIYGNDGNKSKWNDLFTNATNEKGHNATLISGKCPSGYVVPVISDYINLVNIAGDYTQLYKMFGIAPEEYHIFWSSTEYGTYGAFGLYAGKWGASASDDSGFSYKEDEYHLLCYKKTDPIASVSGSGTYSYGATVNISATPNTGHHFTTWVVNSPSDLVLVDSSTSSTSFTMPDSDVMLTADGAIDTHTVTVNKGSGISSVSGSGTYEYGQTVNISATPSTSYTFSSWTVNSGGISTPSGSSASFTMPDANVTITANAAVANCSDTVHPTTTASCKMPDGKLWIVGNNGKDIRWGDMCSGIDNCTSSFCPSGYVVPTMQVFQSLINAAGSGGQLYSALGLSSTKTYWSTSKEPVSGCADTWCNAYYRTLYVSSTSSSISRDYNSVYYGLLCYK